jgi:hypothetical protein
MQREKERIETGINRIKPSIKDRLLVRFTHAIDSLGENWRRDLADYFPIYATKKGKADYNEVNQCLKENSKGRAGVDKIEQVVEDLESIIMQKRQMEGMQG